MGKFINFLLVEDQRNIDGAKTFERFLKRAVGPQVQCIVAHHIVYVDGATPTEIPSADTLLFNPQLMGAVFGEQDARNIMLTLALRDPSLRERVLADFLDALDMKEAAAVSKTA